MRFPYTTMLTQTFKCHFQCFDFCKYVPTVDDYSVKFCEYKWTLFFANGKVTHKVKKGIPNC